MTPKEFTFWLASKSQQGLVMPCADDATPLLTREEALTLSVLSDAMDDLKDAIALVREKRVA